MSDWRRLRRDERRAKEARAKDHEHVRVGPVGSMLILAMFTGWVGWDVTQAALATAGVIFGIFMLVVIMRAVEDTFYD